jgi:hypothetical protein
MGRNPRGLPLELDLGHLSLAVGQLVELPPRQAEELRQALLGDVLLLDDAAFGGFLEGEDDVLGCEGLGEDACGRGLGGGFGG